MKVIIIKTLVTKTFIDLEWLKCIAKIKRFIEEYNLDLVSINIKKIKDQKKKLDYYEATIEYGLNVRQVYIMLYEFRKEHGLKQEEIAKLLGISVSSYSLYENHKREMTLDLIIKFLEIRDSMFDKEVIRVLQEFKKWFD